MNSTIHRSPKSLLVIFIELIATTLFFAGAADAQGTNRSANYTGTIDAGTEIAVRTNETIDTKQANGRVFSGNVAEDVRDTAGNIAIPKGADVELVVKRTIDNDLALDLDAVNINGRRYGVETEENAINSGKKEGIGANKRTGKYVGGGAIIGAIIGGIAGGGKGAAIGAGAGAAAGAGAQVLTKGDRVEVPAESLVTFRLEEPMRTPVLDRGFSRGGVHYHQGYGNSVSASRAFNEGLRAGRADADRNLARNPQTNRWNTDAQRSDYRAGYNQGYDEVRRNR